MSYYGTVFPEFWTGRTGRELRECGGKDAQLLGLYLITNRHTNMLGLYHLLIDDVKHETGLSLKAIERGLTVVGTSTFASFDADTAFVWVRQMARFRLGLKNGDDLHPADKRVLAVNRLYQDLDLNPFLGTFYDANKKPLCLRKRREPVTALVVPFTTTHHMSPLTRGLEGASKGLPSQYQKQDQDQDQGSGTGIRISDRTESAPPARGSGPSAVRQLDPRRRVAPDGRVARAASAPVADELVKKHLG